MKLPIKEFIIVSKETIQRLKRNIHQKIFTNLVDSDIDYPILLKCDCFKNDIKANAFFGCIDRHLFDMATIPYFTLGVYLPFSHICLTILILAKLCRTSKAINELIYFKEINGICGNLRKYQTLLNMLGDILAFIIGSLIHLILSWWVTVFLVFIMNGLALLEKKDIITVIFWYIDCFKYLNRESYPEEAVKED